MADDGNLNSTGLTRRQTLKAAAAVTGASAFATPVVAGVFSTRVSAAQCNPATDSFVVEGTGINGSQSWNQNCGNQGNQSGRYNGQDHSVTLAGGNGNITVQVGNAGNDNFNVDVSFYLIQSANFDCTATFTLQNCGGPGEAAVLMSSNGGNWPAGAQSLPFCHVCSQDLLTVPGTAAQQNRLILAEVFCCPK